MSYSTVLAYGTLAFGVPLLPVTPASSSVAVESPRQSSEAVTFAVRLADDQRRFRPGEIIPVELEFKSSISNRFVVDGALYDRGGRLMLDEFNIDPPDGVTNPLRDYFAVSGGPLGGLRTVRVLNEIPYTIRLELNEWVRFDRPGVYELSVRSHRVTDDRAVTPRPVVVPLDSNTIAFEILQRDVRWEVSQLKAALAAMNSPSPDTDERRGCRMLRFLATDAAVDEMIGRFGDRPECEFHYIAGLFGSPDRARVVRQMEDALRQPDQTVTPRYLRTLAILSTYARHPELQPPQRGHTRARTTAATVGLPSDLVQEAEAHYDAMLTDALPHKTDRARAFTLAARLESAPRSASVPGHARSSHRPLREDLLVSFGALPANRQINLLQYQWHGLKSPGMVPVLRGLVESQRSASPSLADWALRRLYELSPEIARPLIVREIRNPHRDASLRTLGVLPERELPELDDVLVGNVVTSERFTEIHAELLHRYATPRAVSRVLASLGERLPLMACRPQSAVLAYLLRADADVGRTQLNRVLASREHTGCYRSTLRDVGERHMTPVLEATALAHLDDPDPQVAISAAETLGRFGSAVALLPLRVRFEQWHSVWNGRHEELRHSRVEDRPHAMQAHVEFALLQWLARGQAWVLGSAALRELRTLCVTENCRIQADHLVAAKDDTRIRIVRLDEPNDSLVLLAQYQLTSVAALEHKLTQYPRGSRFTVDVSALEPQVGAALVTRIATFAAARGIQVSTESSAR